MTKTRRQMEEDIRLVDLVIELVDARIPLSGKNPDIDTIAGSKSRLILLNKGDLADEEKTKSFVSVFEQKGYHSLAVNSLNSADMKQINEYVRIACAAKIERDQKRGIRNRPVRAMVAGIPNVGKSTFINTFSRKAAAKTGNKPGVTRGKQWIRMSSTLELLDTPGILWPKFEDQTVGLKLALIGSIRDEIIQTEELALELIRILERLYPGALSSYYRLGAEGSSGSGAVLKDTEILEQIAAARGCLLKGGNADYRRTAMLLLENFRNGKIGRFTLDNPEDVQPETLQGKKQNQK